MNIRVGRTLFSVAALAVASLPVASNAREGEALDRCVQTFIKEVVPPEHSVQVRQDDIRASMRSLGANRTKVNLRARGAKYGKLFGRATCVMDRDGSLVAMYVHDTRVRIAGSGRPKVITAG